SCRSLRFTPGLPPLSPITSQHRRSCSVSPDLFRHDVGNGTPPPGFGSHSDDYDDNAYAQALADADTCDNSSCPNGPDAPARYTITVETFDDGTEEFYDRNYRACTACNRACKKSFLGSRIKSRQFDNSVRDAVKAKRDNTRAAPDAAQAPASEELTAQISNDRPPLPNPVTAVPDTPLGAVTLLQDALHTLSARPPMPASFVATVRVRHDALCLHPVASCPTCSLGLVCCDCKRLFTPAVARHLACAQCKHVAFSCCESAYCCQCRKPWMPTDAVVNVAVPSVSTNVLRFCGGGGTDTLSSPEPDIWTPSPRSSPDEIDDLTAQANVPLPTSRPDSDALRAPSRASSASKPVDFAATPLATPDFSALPDDSVDGFVHPSFPDQAVLNKSDKRHFLG
ncbi:hypothetical protein AX14_007867, partial [Amanita brunnescens Koide BX004]